MTMESAPVIKTYGRRPTKTNPALVCCRACLETEGKLYDIHEHKLEEAFTRISGTTVKEDQFPQHLCARCVALLQRCAQFRARCARARLCLLSQLMARNVTIEYIRTIDRFAHRLIDLKQTEVQVTDYIDSTTSTGVGDTPSTDVNQEINNQDTEINNETYDDGNFVDNTEENDIKNINPDTEIAYINDNEVKINGDLFMIKNVDDILKPKNITTIPKIKNPKKRKRLENSNTNKEKISRRKKKKLRNAMNYLLPLFDFAKYESTYGVKIVVLSKEEQLKEIEARRASPKYLEATYRCEPCGKVFSTESIYNGHREHHSSKKGAFECEICTLRMRKGNHLLRHRDTHSLKFVCKCGFVSRTRSQVARHHEMHKGRTFVCEHCGKCYSVLSTYLTHMRLRHPDMNVVCNLCGETFVGTTGLRFHRVRVHAVRGEEAIKCGVCSVVFETPEALRAHAAEGRHAEGGEGGEGGEQGEGGGPCRYCGAHCHSPEALRTHTTDRHPTCDQCSVTFLDAACYQVHYTRKHLGRSWPPAGGAGPRRRRGAGPWPLHPRRVRPQQCGECGAHLPSENSLRLHLLAEHGIAKPYACEDCPLKFDSTTTLRVHRRKHTGEKPFQCDYCKISHNLKSNLQRHILTAHLGKRMSCPCEICGKTFTTPSSAKMHVNTVHLGMPWPKRKRVRRRPDNTPNKDDDSDTE